MRYGLLLFLLITLWGCSSKHEIVDGENKKIIHIALGEKTDNAALFFDYDHFVVLETTDESLIKRIDRVEFYNSAIYILDSALGCIFVFDKSGKYKYKIDQKGEGPEKYLSAHDFYIDKENQLIFVYDGFGGHVYALDLLGDFQYRVEVAKGYSMIKLDKDNWLFYLANSASASGNKNFNNLLWYSQDFKIFKEELPINKKMIGRRYSAGVTKSVFSEYDDYIYFLPLLSNRIYRYDSDRKGLVLEYEIVYDVPEFNIVIDERTKESDVEKYLNEISRGERPSRINSFYKLGNVVFFNLSYKGQPLMCIYDEEKDETKLCEIKTHENGLVFSPPSVFYSDTDNKNVLSIIDGALFDYCREQNKANSSIIQNIDSEIGQLEDSNPILVFYSLK